MLYFIYRFSFFVLAFVVFLYLAPQSPSFPKPPPDSVQSLEKADTEDVLRRSYFTQLNRQDILKHYQAELGQIEIFGQKVPSYGLNYPPEDAFWLIRDQTRSTFLEEIVHPFRESLYINGFQPKVDKDDIWYKGYHYKTKITIKYAPSPVWLRLSLLIVTLPILLYISQSLGKLFVNIIKEWRKYG